ncbi:putative ribonuclease H-like domain-containing protein [Tanacetum coccineum]
MDNDYDFHDNKMVEKPVLNNKGRVTGQRKIKLVWNNAQRVNHQNKLTNPHPKMNFVPTAVATKSGQVPVNAAKQSSPRAATSISTARPINTATSKPKVNDALPITYSYFKAYSLGNPQYTLQDQGIFDSGCSRHMTGNKSFLTDYQEIDGGFVAFGGSPKGGKITGKGGLTCLFAKATIDESNLWHRRLGHINFKTMNKLVRGNLVRGLPSKLFENDHTCVACQKGKQHKASYPLGKFDGKADEGFLVRYSINSKAFRVFNTRTRKVEENLHITFLENKPNVAGSGPDWLFDIDLLTNSMNYESVTTGNQTNRNASIKDNVDAVPTQQYILLPLLYDCPQSLEDAVTDDASKKTNEKLANEGEINGQEKEGGASNKEVSTVSPFISAAGQSFDNTDDLPTDPLMPDLKDTADLLNTGIFSGAYDAEDEGAEADLNNLETTMNVYVDDIIFRSTKKSLCVEFEQMMHKRFQMSSMGELTVFLGLQVKQKGNGIFISQDKYVADILKKFDFIIVKTTSTSIEINKALLKDEEAEDMDVHLYRSMIGSLMYLTVSRPDIIDSPFDLEVFSNSDYAGASLDKKSTTGGCQFLGKRLISWQCKKQTIVANSTTKVEYVAAANCCGQVLWIQNQMLDYGFNFINTKIHIDNESTICIVKNPVFHAKTKHIEIMHHFIRYSYEKRLI